METIREAKQYLRDNWEDKSVKCPCCGQDVYLQKYSIGHTMARFLIELVKEYEDTGEYIHFKELCRKVGMISGDYAKLRHWGLIIGKEKDPKEDKRASGYFKPTGKGISYAYKQMPLQKIVRYYNGRVYRFEGDWVDIEECLGTKFSWNQLMAGRKYNDGGQASMALGDLSPKRGYQMD